MTARRFQRRHTAGNHCALGCGGAAEDSIEHYSRCQTVRKVASRFLCLEGADQFGLAEMLFADGRTLADDECTCRALLIYATYRGTNHFRANGPASPDVAFDALV